MSSLVTESCSRCPWCGVKLSRTFNSPLVFDSGFCRDSYYTAKDRVELVAPVLKETGGNISEAARRLGMSPSTVVRYAVALKGSKTERRAQYIALIVKESGGDITESAIRLRVSRSTVMRYMKIVREGK